jgi:CRP-like cAMP-binding protein
MNAEDAAVLLGQTTMFRGLDEAALERLAEQAEERSYRSHEVIFREGDVGEGVFAIADGMVKLEVKRGAGDRMVLTTLQPLDTFGELSLLHGGARSATAVALTATRLLNVPKAVFMALLTEEPTLAEAVLGSFGSLVRRLTAQTADLALLDLKARVAKVLVALAERQTRPTKRDRQPVLELRLTQSELAQMAGGSRQSTTQVLGNFQTRGLIELRHGTVVIKRLDLLRSRAGN